LTRPADSGSLDRVNEASTAAGERDLALWDAAAATYAARVGGGSDSFYRRIHDFLWEAVGDVRGRDVLDLGCGHGWLAEEFRLAGARVTGIDGSAALLEQARTRYPEISFRRHDLTLGLPHTPARDSAPPRYDCIVAHMVLMDIPHLDRLLADTAAALRPDGVFVFSILHPAFYSRRIVDEPTGERYRMVPDYLTHETRQVTSFGEHHHYHRPLSWYIQRLAAHGFLVSGMVEPPSLPREDIPEQQWSDYQRWFSRIPTMLAISCVPAGGRAPRLSRP
jgi:2-polyprenyl-3-methyl-5-hydroxy-6-metoxy-1,4-benzoquinol methylase